MTMFKYNHAFSQIVLENECVVLRFSGNRLPCMMDIYMLVMIRFGRRCFTADMTRVWPVPTVYSHMILQIIGAMKRLTTQLAVVHLGILVLLHVSLAVVLSDKFRPAIVARVGLEVFVRIHVRDKVALANESAPTKVAFERFLRSGLVRVSVQLQVPLCGELFAANGAAELLDAGVGAQVRFEGGFQIRAFAHGTFGVCLQNSAEKNSL